MKRVNNLYSEVMLLDNFLLGYYKAKKGKSYKKDVVKFSKDLHNNVMQLMEDIKNRDLKMNKYYSFYIYEPKKRLISSTPFKMRVLQHSIMNVCDDYFESYQIYDSYASRKGKGVHKALSKAKKNQSKYKYFLKLDIHKYFDSIDHQVLKDKLETKFKDKKLLELFFSIIDGYQVIKGKGVPIGNLTSQYFANFYLSFIDHFIKEELLIKGYVRYMDDFVLWSDNRIYLKETLSKIEGKLSEFKLKLNPIILNNCNHGLPFIGYRVFKNYTLLNKQSKKRFVTKVNSYGLKLVEGEWSDHKYKRHISSVTDFALKAKTRNLREKHFKGINYWTLTV